jgi:hypothetical protein
MRYFRDKSRRGLGRGRFAASFPLLDQALSTYSVPVTIVACAVPAAIYSLNLGLSILYLNALWVAYNIDRRHLDTLLITPFSALAIYWFYSLGLGPAFLSLSKGGESPPELVQVQLVGLFGFAVFAVMYQWQCRRLPAIAMPAADAPGSRSFYSSLRVIGFCLVAFTLTLILIRAVTGIGERGHIGEERDAEFAGDIRVAFLGLFYRFEFVGVMFVGLLVRSKNITARVLAFTTIAVYLVFGFTSGTRGLILHPLIAFTCGFYMFGGSTRTAKMILLIGITAGLPLIWVMGTMRQTKDFYDSRITDVSTRFELGTAAASSISETGLNEQLEFTGRALLGVSDELVYKDTPGAIPFVGWDGTSGMLLAFVPHVLRPGTANLGDENDIVSEYTGLRLERSFQTISFFADMFRRFGFTGIVVGSIVAGWFYGAVSAFVISLFHSRRKLYGLLMILLLMGSYTFFPFSTMLRCSWIWLYDVPKHVLALIAFVMVVKSLNADYRRTESRNSFVLSS